MTKLEIINTALAELALPPLISTDFSSNEFASRIGLIYKVALKYMLESYNWRFALTTVLLDKPIKTPEDSLYKLYEFQIPNNIARFYKVETENIDLAATPFYGTYLSRFGNLGITNLSLLMNYDTREDILYTPGDRVLLTYVKSDPKERLFTGIFITVLVLKLKQSLIFTTTEQGVKAEQALEVRIRTELKKAIRTGAVQKRLPSVQQDLWYNARFYGSFTV